MQENKNEMIYGSPKKGNGGLIILVVLLLLICLGLAGFIFVSKDKLFSSNKTTDSDNEEVIEKEEEIVKKNLGINDSLVTGLFETFRIDKACWVGMRPLVLNENRAKLRIAYQKLGNNLNSVKQSDLKEKVLEIFGKDYDYKDEDFGIGVSVEPTCGIMRYVTEENLYKEESGACGGTCALGEQKITKAYIEGKKLIIETTYKDLDGVAAEYRKDGNYTYEFKEESTDHYVFVKITKE